MENVEMKIENQKIQIKNLELKNERLKMEIATRKKEAEWLEETNGKLMVSIERQRTVIQSLKEEKNKDIQALTDQFNVRGDVILNLQKVIDEKNEIISGLEHDVKNLKNGNDLLRKSIYVRDRKIPDMQKNLETKDKDIQALMDQLDARDREIEKYKFMVIQMADDLYGKGDLDRGEEE